MQWQRALRACANLLIESMIDAIDAGVCDADLDDEAPQAAVLEA